MSEEPENLVLQLLRGIRGDVAKLDAKVDETKAELKAEFKADIASLRSEIASDMKSLRADVASDMLRMEKDTRDQIVGLRRAVIEYHSAVVGHGVLISELEARVRRVEQHLNLPSMDSH